MSKLQEYVDDINENVDKLDSRGPVSKYVLPDENLRGRSLSLSQPFSYLILDIIWMNPWKQCCTGNIITFSSVVYYVHLKEISFSHINIFSSILSSLQNSYVEFFFFLSYSLTLSFDETMSGVACDLNSRGFHVLCKATEEVVGHVKPYSITGSLPLIRELQVIIWHSSICFSSFLWFTHFSPFLFLW